METNIIYNEECLQGMEKLIPDSSIDMILADLPYGTTACKWDSVIPLEPLWEQYKRIVKDNTAIVLTGTQPFTSQLVKSNIEWFKNEWIWVKEQGTNQFQADNYPLKQHENILVFARNSPNYYPQYEKTERITRKPSRNKGHDPVTDTKNEGYWYDNEGKKYPTTILKVKRELTNRYHPTQKPVDLFKYLIKTYTNKGDIVLDNAIGSGTTAVAAKALDREYIGFEQDPEYYEIAQERVSEVQKELI